MLGPWRLVVIGGVVAAGLSGCCGECLTYSDDYFLSFAFSADSVGGSGFRRRDLRSAYVVTYGRPGFQGTTDTARQTRVGTGAAQGLVLYPSTMPPVGQLTFSLYAQPGAALSYRVFVPAAGRVYAIDDVSHVFSEGTGRCACSRVEEKRFTLNGQPEVQRRKPLLSTDQPTTVLAR